MLIDSLSFVMYYHSVHAITDNYTHIMKYMGSKRELLHEIRTIIAQQSFTQNAVLDLFAGTCGVGMALRDLAPVYSNDIQQYSSVIARGCLSVNTGPLTKDEILTLLGNNYRSNYEALKELLPGLAECSESYKNIAEWNDENRTRYIEFAEAFAVSALGGKTHDEELVRLQKEYVKRSTAPRTFPYLQTVAVFSEMYFSLDQAMAIDSIRYSIDQLPKSSSYLKYSLFAALIHAYSYASAGTGHFAQFRDLSTLSSIKDVFLYRKKSVLDLFLRKAEEILSESKKNAFAKHNKAFTRDYLELLDDHSVVSKVGLIYADPPYSFVHYSRFYHAIEDLCRYDYPEVEHKGRYRKDRHQSPFCIKTKAPKAFSDMFERAFKYRTPLLVSYSNTGMITLDVLGYIARSNGYNIEALELDHKHSTMGRLKDKHRNVKEALLFCSVS